MVIEVLISRSALFGKLLTAIFNVPTVLAGNWKLNKLLSSERHKLNKILSKNLIKYEVGTKQNIKSETLGASTPKDHQVPKERFKEIKAIVNFFNLTLERSFRYQSTRTKVPINARLNEGFTLDDFKLVIEDRAKKWRNDGTRPVKKFGSSELLLLSCLVC